MNRELMEKVAKRAEDPNYPYGNKLGKGHVIKSGIGEIGSNIAIGTLAGTIPGTSLGALVAQPMKGALIGAGAGAALGIIGAPTSYKSGKRAGEQYRYISYLPSNEQQALKKKMDILEDKQDAINEKQDEIYSKEYSNERSRDNARLQLRRYSQQFDALTEQRKELWNNALARGKALMLAEKKNRRLLKTASDYLDEAVMEKEAKRKEDPNYPYGNKLGKGHSVKSALKTAVPLSSIGAALGGLSAAPVWIDDRSQKKTRDKLLHSGIETGIGAAIGGAIGATYGYKDGQNKRYLSYLPSNEQLKLSQSLSKLEASDNKIRTRNENVEIDDDEACVLYAQNIKKRDKLLGDAHTRGKALMLAEKKNRRLFKKASCDYDEYEDIIKMAYEDIVNGFEKEAKASDYWVAIGNGLLHGGVSGLTSAAAIHGGTHMTNALARKIKLGDVFSREEARRFALATGLVDGAISGTTAAIKTIHKRREERERDE